MHDASYMWKKSGGASTCKSGPFLDSSLMSENDIQDNPENQCLFVCGFKMSLSEKTWKNMWNPTDVVTVNESGNKTFNPDESTHRPGTGSNKKTTNGNDENGSGAHCLPHDKYRIDDFSTKYASICAFSFAISLPSIHV
ncbi:hypothetical protein BDQ17DRAFT_1422723 [Cyathus striatus]|nr:hypothetical protein BDQ17DRAFT_1422723 [Cyathus striatus]